MADGQFNVIENTTDPIADLDCGKGENPDAGQDICTKTHKEMNGFGEDTGKPTSYILSLGELSSNLVTSDGTGKVNDKVKVGAVGGTDDGDGSYYVVVSKNSDPSKTDGLFFQGTVEQGDNFTAAGSFGSATYVHIFSAQGGSLLQTINFHTSCSSPLIIGDEYGSITLEGATLVGKDSGTTYTVGATETDGDAGVVYEITGGNDADDFVVDPDTGVVTFKSPPDFENPTDSDGDNKYDVVVTAFFVDANGNKTGEICEVKPLEVCVGDDCINVLENTSPVIADLDCGEEENPDLGRDACEIRDQNGYDKPAALTFTLGDGLSNAIVSSQDDGKVVVESTGLSDTDGSFYIVVSRDDDPSKTDKLYFSGDVAFGQSFTALSSAINEDFGGSTYLHIFSESGGQLLQSIEFHTSCSQPIVIGDQFGSISLTGFGFDNDGQMINFGVSDAAGDAGVVYEITGGNDADDFTVDPNTGVVTFKSPPDFENPTDSDGDNKYDVEVTAFFVDANGNKTGEICEVKPLEVCVGDDCINVLENTSPVIADLDCGKGENPDLGTDICAVTDKDENGFGEDTEKPSSFTLSLGDELTSEINSTQGDKLEVGNVMPGDDGDGSYYILVSDDDDPSKLDKLYFSGAVGAGESFTANGIDGKFGSETFVHIFSAQGGTLLQTINFHTSCSAPLVIGDQYGSITLEGAALEGKDSGTIYQIGATETDGDAGVVYEITGGNDADDFVVDPDTGVVTFKSPPDFENPTDSDGDNKYDVEVTAFFVDANGNKTGEICEVKPLEVCVGDQDCIEIFENTTGPVVDLDATVECEVETPGGDMGLFVCQAIDDQDLEKPSELTLTLGDVINPKVSDFQPDGKSSVATTGASEDGDGLLRVIVSDDDDPTKLDTVYFDGAVSFGQSFTALAANAGDDKFSSNTYVHILDDDGTLLQTIQYHTSCSAPIVIGDQVGSVTVTGVGALNKDTGQIVNFGGTTMMPTTLGEGDIVYSIVGGDDADAFTVDPETGEVSFINPPDFEASSVDGDDNYEVIVRASAKDDPECFTDTPVEICVKDVVEVGSLSGRYFCDTNDNDVDDGQGTDPGVAGVVVTAFDAAGNAVGTAVTDATGTYTISGLAEGTYSVVFTDPDNVLEGKALVTPDVGNDDTIDSDAIGNTDSATIDGIVVNAGQDTPDNDAGAEKLPGSLSGRYFCDTNDNDVDDGQGTDPGVAGVVVTAFDAAGNAVGTAVTDATGTYTISGLAEGTYSVVFTDPDNVLEGKALVTPDVGNDDTIDSDAIGNTDSATIDGIVVNAGQDTPDNDAGAEKLPGSLSGRYFCDTNDNDVDDGQGTDPGVAGVVVTAFDAAGNAVGTAVTDATGTYTISGLAEGTYSVVFTDPDNVLEGKALVTPDVGNDDTIDSDAIGNTDSATIDGIVVNAGQDTPDNDAGAEKLPGSLSGRYFCDTNDNDVDDGQGTDPGVAGVVVTAFDAAGNAVGTAVTDATGTYTISGLAEGTYSVVFTDPDNVLEGKALVTPDVGNDDTIDSDAIGNTDSATIDGIVVNAGQDTPDNDAGAEKLPGSLSGRYFCDTNDNDVDDGQGTDPGVAGVVVTAFDAAGNAVGTAVTDATGTYTISGLAEGTYSVVFTDPDNVLEGKALVTPDVGNDDTIDSDAIGNTDSATIDGIVVNAGQDTPDNDAGAEKLPGSLSGRYFCDTNDNDVDDGQGTDPGVAGVVVTAFDAAGNAVGTAVTDATGTYTISGLAEGTYSVVFTDPDNVLEGKALVTPDVGNDDTIDSDAIGNTDSATIDGIVVNAGQDTPDNDAGAEKLPGSLSGRYFCDTNDNDVDDGQGTDPGVAGVVVTAFDAAGNAVGTAVTDATGTYTISGLAEGTYSVVFTDPDNVLEGKALVTPDVGNDDTIDSDAIGNTDSATIDGIVVNAGQDTPDNDAGAEKLPGSLSGRYFCDTNDNDVDDGQGTDPGVAGVVVTAFDAAGNAVGTAVTDATGTYTISGLAEGTYSVVFTDPDNVLEGKALVTPDVGNDDTIDSDAIGNTDSATIDGIVVNAGQDTPDNDAGAEKLPGSLSGRYFCDTNDNDVDDGQGTDPGVAGVVVTAFDAAGNAVGTAVTDATGTYTISGLAEGTYSVVFTDPDNVLEGKALVTPDVGNDDTIDSDAIGNTDSATIDGIVVNAGQDTPDNDAGAEKLPGSLSGRYFCDTNDNDVDDGQGTDPGVAGVVVTAFDAAGNAVGTAVTDATGTYTISGLAEGTYSVVFTDPDNVLEGKALVTPDVGNDDTIDSDAIGNTDSATIDGIVVNAGQDTPDNDAGAEKLPGSLSGRYFCDTNDNDVDDGQGTDPGVAGVVVTAFDAAGNAVGTAVTDATGTYTISGLAEGTYSVVFTDPDNVLEGKALVTPDVGNDDTIDSDAIGNTDSATIDGIVVNAGQDTPDNDAGAEKLPGSLSGRYFCDTNDNDVDDGQGTDPGVAGVVVTAFDAAGNAVGTAVTDATGTYTISGLAEGTYSVVFTDPDNVLEGKALVTPDVGNDDTIDSDAIGNTDSATIDGIVVNAGQDTPDNDAGAEKLPGSLSGRYFCDTNDNDVDDGQGTDPGVAGVVVTAFDAAGNAVGTAVTDATGTYTISGLAEGTYSVVFTDPDNVLEGKALVTPDVGNDDTIDSDAIGNTDSATIDGIVVNAGQDTPDNDAGAEKLPGSLSGRYFCDTNDNDVDDGQGTDPGVAGVVVTAFDAAGNAVGTAVTDATGTYTISGLAEGTYSVVFTDPDNVLEGKALVTPDVGNDDTIDSDAIGNTDSATIDGIVVNAGQDTPDNDAGAEKLPGSLSGRYFCDTNDNDVDDGQGTDPGVAGVVVTAFDAAGNAVGTAVTDATGTYTISGLAEGTYSVVFTDPDNVLEGKALVTPDVGNDDTIDSDAIGNTDSATIDGIVVNAGQDTPDNDAGAEKLPGSLSGRYFCDTNDNDVDDGQGTDPGVAGVVVTAFDAAGNAVGTAVTDATGTYTISGLAEGTYSVVFTDPDNVLEGKALVTPDVGNDDTIDSDAIGNTDSATIDGIVVNAGQDTPDNDAGAEKLPGSLSGRYFCDTNDNDVDDGQGTDPGVAGVVVTAFDAAGNAVGTAVTDATGTYTISGLAEGTYSVVFTDPDNVLEGKALVTPDVGNDDTIDSDAIGNTDSATIDGIVVNAGQDTPDNDAGAEKLPGSLSGRYFCDENGNDIDDAGDTAVAGKTVMLFEADGTTPATDIDGAPVAAVVTDSNGAYSFGNLAAASYVVMFESSAAEGKEFVAPDVGDEAEDSDVIDPAGGKTAPVQVFAGQNTPDVDAGVVDVNEAPTAVDDRAVTCADKTVTFSLLANDTDPEDDPLSVVGISDEDETAAPGGSITLASGATVTLNADGTVTYDGTAAYSDLVIRDTAQDSFSYTVSDGALQDTGDVDVGICGALNTRETVLENLPSMVMFETIDLDPSTFAEAFTMNLSGSGDPRLDGMTIEAVYCIDALQPQADNVLEQADLRVANFENAKLTGLSDFAANNMDLVNWIINQDFSNRDDDNDGVADFTDAEVQGAIWELTNGDDFLFGPGGLVGDGPAGTQAGSDALLALAQDPANEGYVPGANDLIGLIVDPAPGGPNQQPYIIAVDLAEECVCDLDTFMFV